MCFKTRGSILKIFFSLCIACVLYLGYLMLTSSRSLSLDNGNNLSALPSTDYDSNHNLNYKIALKELVFKGVDRNANFYTLSAKHALKDSNDLYQLKYIDMVYDLGSNRSLRIFSRNALLDEKAKILDLRNGVNFFSEDISFCGNEIQIDLVNHEIISNSSITLSNNNSKTTANSMSTHNGNHLIILKGNVCTTISLTKL